MLQNKATEPAPRRRIAAAVAAAVVLAACGTAVPAVRHVAAVGERYPWHTDIVATTFWVGEIFDPSAADGSQVLSTYDSRWLESYGGCDGVMVGGRCETEPRVPSNGYFPLHMSPRQNPFYLDLPYDDVHHPEAFARRAEVVPWAAGTDPGLAADPAYSYLQNRWVRLKKDGAICYGQIQDAGPGNYNDAAYVFGTDDARPANTKYNGAGLDVSPALNGCLGFSELNGQNDRVDWQFVDEADVPDGPWRLIVTASPVQ